MSDNTRVALEIFAPDNVIVTDTWSRSIAVVGVQFGELPVPLAARSQRLSGPT